MPAEGYGDLAAAWCPVARAGKGQRACARCIAAARDFRAAVATAHGGA